MTAADVAGMVTVSPGMDTVIKIARLQDQDNTLENKIKIKTETVNTDKNIKTLTKDTKTEHNCINSYVDILEIKIIIQRLTRLQVGY